MNDSVARARDIVRDYYDSSDADAFYSTIWGGEDIHIGLYDGDPSISIAAASRRTVEAMAGRLARLRPGARVLDMGSGYGGAARVLAGAHDASLTCINLSRVENERNRRMSIDAGLADRIEVLDASFDDLPVPDQSFDIVWSQDAILHAPDRRRVLAEAARVLKPGGELIFTDPMQADEVANPAALQPIYDRIHLDNLASIAFYRDALAGLGFVEVNVEERTSELRSHYVRVRAELSARAGELHGKVSGPYIERMLAGLQHWVDGADAGLLAWAILHYRSG